MTMSSRLNPTLADVLDKVTEYRTRQVNTAEPGRIISFDKKHNRAEVELCIKGKLLCVDGMETMPAPLLPTVPVLWPRGGGSFITWPLKRGDYCLVVFQKKSIDQWCGKGGTQVDPILDWHHHLSDAVCLPGFYPYPEALPESEQLDDAISLGFEKGSARLRVREDVVEVGGADYAIALAEKVEAALETLKQAIATAPVAPLDGGFAFKSYLMAALGLTPPTDPPGEDDPPPPKPEPGPAWPPDLGAEKGRTA